MRHFGVELYAVEAALLAAHGGAGAAVGMRNDAEAGRRAAHIVGVAHPADAFLRQAVEKRAVLGKKRHLAVLADAAGRADIAARHPSQQLVAVADTQHRDAKLQDTAVEVRGRLVIDAVWPARKDDAGIAGRADLRQRYPVVAAHLGIDVLLAHAARDELVVLTAEVKNEYLFHTSSR